MRTSRLATAALLAALATACGGGTGGVEVAGSGPSADPTGTWMLTEAEPDGPLVDDLRVTLTVEENGDAHGRTACNQFVGRADWDSGGAWSLGGLGSNDMGCEEPRMAAERAYLDALTTVDAWRLDDDGLVLDGGGTTLRYTRAEEVPTAALVDTTWQLTGHVRGDAVTSPPAGTDPTRLRFEGGDDTGTVALVTPCRSFEGEWVRDGDAVSLPIFGEVDGSPDPLEDCSQETAEWEERALEVVGDTMLVAIEDDRLTVTSAFDPAAAATFEATDEPPATGPAPRDDASETCISAIAMSEDGDGAPTREAALEAFIRGETSWWDPPAGYSLDGTTIVFDGEPVGEVSLFQFSNGTWAVSGFEVCAPPGAPRP